MIKFQATAIIASISPAIEIQSKNGGQSFFKRELVLDDSWTKDGNTYPNLVLIEFSNDRMSLLDNFMPGQRVTVEAYINGRRNHDRVFNTIRGLSITPFQPQQTTHSVGQRPAQTPPPGGYAQQPNYHQAPAYPSQGTYPPGGYSQQAPYPSQNGYTTQGPAPQPTAPHGADLGPENLPFR